MSGSIHVGRIAGISIDIHFTWFIIFALVVLWISVGVLGRVPGLEPAAQWGLGVIVSLVFFGSLLLHELAHSLVARRLGVGISGITLFIFGGVSRMKSEPDSANQELAIAAVGPATSAALGILFFGSAFLLRDRLAEAVYLGLWWLGLINFILAGFNLVPGFPLDGGRLLRAVVWSVTGDLRQATYIASMAGQGIAYMLMAGGVFSLFVIPGMAGLWYILIGWFLLDAARSSYEQQVVRSQLSGVRVKDIMTPDPVTIPADATLQEAVDEYFLRRNFAVFPVTDNGELRGVLALRHVREVPREQWAHVRVAQVVEPLLPEHIMHPHDDAWQALTALAGVEQGVRLLVAEHGRIAGIVSRTDIMRFLRTKMGLGM